MALWFVGNSIENALLQTGAFEIEYNGIPIWSKLKSGHVPQVGQLLQILNNEIKHSGGPQTAHQNFDPSKIKQEQRNYKGTPQKEPNDEELLGTSPDKETEENHKVDDFDELNVNEEPINDEL